jgi:Transposase DDE domain group 1
MLSSCDEQHGKTAHLCELPVPGQQLATAAQRVARLECSLQPVAGATGMRQEVDIHYAVTSLAGSAQHLYANIYCQRGQMENLIKLTRRSWRRIARRVTALPPIRSASFFTPAALRLMHGIRTAIPQTSPLASA